MHATLHTLKIFFTRHHFHIDDIIAASWILRLGSPPALAASANTHIISHVTEVIILIGWVELLMIIDYVGGTNLSPRILLKHRISRRAYVSSQNHLWWLLKSRLMLDADTLKILIFSILQMILIYYCWGKSLLAYKSQSRKMQALIWNTFTDAIKLSLAAKYPFTMLILSVTFTTSGCTYSMPLWSAMPRLLTRLLF